MLKKCKQPQAGFAVAKPRTTNPDVRTLDTISLRLTGTVPLEQDYQSQVPGTGWGGVPDGTRPFISISGGPGAETLTSRPVRLPEDLEVYVGDQFVNLAVGCFYLLLGMTYVMFPTSNRAAPSKRVLVVQGAAPLLRSGDAGLFPLTVDWRRWREAVVPVLQDDRWHPSMPVNNRRVLQERYSEFVELLEKALVQSFRDAGYLPQEL